MLFNINKQNSLAFLQIFIAAFILLAPSLSGLLSDNAVVYLMFAVFGGLITLRLKTTGKIYVSVYHMFYLFIAVYSVLSLLWVKNREGQLIYIFALCGIVACYSAFYEYFSETSGDGIRRRMMYMLCFSGALCAFVNVLYWLFFIVPVAGNEPFSFGLGTENVLGIFIALCIMASVFLIKGNSKGRKVIIIANIILMSFVFVMTKNFISWAFAVILSALLILKRNIKSDKKFVFISLGCTFLFFLIVIFKLKATASGKVFSDVFSYAAGNIFGKGGGFWSEREIFSSLRLPEKLGVGLLPCLYAASGFFGILCAVFIAVKNLLLFIKVKSYESLIGLLLTVVFMLMPFGGNFTVILLWVGLSAYNERSLNSALKIKTKESSKDKKIYFCATLVVLSVFFTILAFFKMNADSNYKNKNYEAAYEMYKTVAVINRFDSESCRMAAASIRNSGNLSLKSEEAITLVDNAINRDSNNIKNIIEKALIYDSCEKYELCAQEYREALQRVLLKDEYNLALAEVLYKIVEKNPKGSSETKRAYEEIVSIAQSTENLDRKKEINDIADKALSYTKGELSDEK